MTKPLPNMNAIPISLAVLAIGFASASATDLRDWRPPYEKWQAVKDVALKPDNPARFALTEGQGAIVNGAEGNTANLFTRQQHGDARVEIEFVVPKGSNSGVYLQGRYEIQVFDSHGKANPEHSDCGGIYQRWDDKRQPQGFEGRPPLVNAAKKPGEWQKFEIVFRAPRFDASGKKTANAKFESVHLNGQLVQQNQEVTGPTRAAAFEDEQPLGPLMVQGDHGPVAYRNLKIEPLENSGKTSLLPDSAYSDLAAYRLDQSRKAVSRVEETLASGKDRLSVSQVSFRPRLCCTAQTETEGCRPQNLPKRWLYRMVAA